MTESVLLQKLPRKGEKLIFFEKIRLFKTHTYLGLNLDQLSNNISRIISINVLVKLRYIAV